MLIGREFIEFVMIRADKEVGQESGDAELECVMGRGCLEKFFVSALIKVVVSVEESCVM